MGIMSDLFTWWNGATIGTRVYTALVGRLVGTDEFGNRYMKNRRGRRWVIYNGYAEASSIPPGWYGWMHKTVDEPPSCRKLSAARMGEAAPAQSHRHAGSLSSAGQPLFSRSQAAAAGLRALAAQVTPIPA